MLMFLFKYLTAHELGNKKFASNARHDGMCLNPTTLEQMHVDTYEFEASLIYIASCIPAKAT